MSHFLKAGDKGQAPTVPYAVRGNVVSLSERRPAVALVEDPETPDLSGEVDQLARELRDLQSRLEYLRGAVEPHSLAGSVLGLMGNNAEEIRTQIRPLRAALKSREGDAA